MRNNDMRNNDIRKNDDRIENIIQSIRDYDYLLDTAFERNAATITIQKIRGILGMEGYKAGVELNKRGRDITKSLSQMGYH
jgi:hypothetical protein